MSKVTPLPSIFLDNGYKSGASMWFSLDSTSTWGPSVISAASPQAVNLPISSGSSFFAKTEKQNVSDLDWQNQAAVLKKTVTKPKSVRLPQADAQTKKSPADDFIQVPVNQRWSAQPIGFPQIQNQFNVVEKKQSPASSPTKIAQNLSSIQSLSQQSEINNATNNGDEDLTPQSLYKTELCRSFEETGACRYGLKCQFAHGRPELRPVTRHPKYKTEVCKTFHTIGTCPYGKRCRFIHIDQGIVQQQSQTPTNSSPILAKPIAEYSNALPQNDLDGWSNNWSEPTPVNVFSAVGKSPFVVSPPPPKPQVIETLPVMKTSNDELNQRRSRLVIFQQICS
eukprot:TRINITY_DN8200_c0_g1_i1.p1 TRINITY_DN8200_c0_g1~~TRINITY_DN8200_c0_g1_i1.p1  ORF type:complete len:338 (-),score=59.55 TRINITY_DN8200_c0_g1_i1:174-1187(-)